MDSSIETTIDSAGRIVVPKRLRDEMQLTPGQKLSLVLRDGVLEIEPAAEPVKLKRVGRFVVATANGRAKLTAETVRRTRARVRDGR